MEEQLLECLQEQSKKEERIEAMALEVERQKVLVRDLGDVRGLLYRDHVRLRTEWRSERAKLVKETRNAQALAKEAAFTCAEKEKLVDKLKGGTQSELKAALVKAANELTLTQVRELRLVRTVEVTRAAEKAHFAEKEELVRELEDQLTSTARRTGEMQRSLEAAEHRCQVLQTEVDLSVRKEAYAELASANRGLQSRYAKLVVLKTDAVVQDLESATLADELAAVKAENVHLVEECAHHQSRADELEEALPTLRDPRLESIEALKAQSVHLKVELAGFRRQGEFDTKERKRLQEAKDELETRLKGVEAELKDASVSLFAAREVEAGHLRRLATSVSLDQYRLDAAATLDVRKQLMEGQAQISLERERAEMAEARLDKAVWRNHTRDLELNGLREAMRSMEQTSDARAALGKLHEEVLRLRSREVFNKHGLARAEVKSDRLESDHQRLLKRVNEKEALNFVMQQDLKHLLAEHEEALQRLEGAARGRIDERKAAEWSASLMDIKHRHKASNLEVESLKSEKYALADQLLASEARLEQVRRMFPESRCMFPESRCMFPGSRCMFPESRCMFLGSHRTFPKSCCIISESRWTRRMFPQARRKFPKSCRMFP
jgi:soluble P-type ATPase